MLNFGVLRDALVGSILFLSALPTLLQLGVFQPYPPSCLHLIKQAPEGRTTLVMGMMRVTSHHVFAPSASSKSENKRPCPACTVGPLSLTLSWSWNHYLLCVGSTCWAHTSHSKSLEKNCKKKSYSVLLKVTWIWIHGWRYKLHSQFRWP